MIEPLEKVQACLYDIAPINIFLSLQILLLNGFVIHHYFPRRNKFVPKMFIAIGIVDVLAALGFMAQSLAVLLFYRDHVGIWILKWGFVVYYILGLGFYTTSIFYNMLLTITRTIHIVIPFHLLDYRGMVVVVVLHGVVCAVLLGVDLDSYFSVGNRGDYDLGLVLLDTITSPHLGNHIGELLVTFVIEHGGTFYHIYGIAENFMVTVFYLIPVAIVLVCMVLQMVGMLNSGPRDVDQPFLVRHVRHVNITVFLISMLFFVCNSTMSVWLIWYMLTDISTNTKMYHAIIIQGIASTTLPLINAAFGPVIIICRSTALRACAKEKIKAVVASLRRVCCLPDRDGYARL